MTVRVLNNFPGGVKMFQNNTNPNLHVSHFNFPRIYLEFSVLGNVYGGPCVTATQPQVAAVSGWAGVRFSASGGPSEGAGSKKASRGGFWSLVLSLRVVCPHQGAPLRAAARTETKRIKGTGCA